MNLVISIVLVQKIGLVGIYIGTIVSGMIANITKPFIIYRVCFGRTAYVYFKDSVKYIGVNAGVLALLVWLKGLVMAEVSVPVFAVMVVLISAVYNGVFLAVFGRCEEFRYVCGVLRRRAS